MSSKPDYSAKAKLWAKRTVLTALITFPVLAGAGAISGAAGWLDKPAKRPEIAADERFLKSSSGRIVTVAQKDYERSVRDLGYMPISASDAIATLEEKANDANETRRAEAIGIGAYVGAFLSSLPAMIAARYPRPRSSTLDPGTPRANSRTKNPLSA